VHQFRGGGYDRPGDRRGEEHDHDRQRPNGDRYSKPTHTARAAERVAIDGPNQAGNGVGLDRPPHGGRCGERAVVSPAAM